ncbi:hypothetical protein BDN70DRAFT_995805 [Pholiota conissans]|uniref:BTB domain-containing protein n=1 Tax=Pholiota conissans TaxID=109636 RepID=A0A9P5YV84_9AGAR|nr:hypothetical protein BDN70DRAFT_995805 [Pholiota conissans]
MDPAITSSIFANALAGLVSKTFCAPDANVTFISSDDIRFKIHQTHLNASTSIGFARPDGVSTGSEVVQLSEPAKVVEILFQFIQPPSEAQNNRQPSISNIEITLFFQLAEAAEKYVVYGAMNVCMMRMGQIVDDHPFDVLNHCVKHGYSDLADVAAKNAIPLPLDQAALKLTAPGLLAKYVTYYTTSRKLGDTIAAKLADIALINNCPIWTTTYILYRRHLDKNPLLFHEIPPIPTSSPVKCTVTIEDPNTICSCSGKALRNIVDKVTGRKELIVKFSSITV